MPIYKGTATIIVLYEIDAPSRSIARDLLDQSYVETDIVLSKEGDARIDEAEMSLEDVEWTDDEEDMKGDRCTYCGGMVPEDEGRELTIDGGFTEVAHDDCAIRLGWTDQDEDENP